MESRDVVESPCAYLEGVRSAATQVVARALAAAIARASGVTDGVPLSSPWFAAPACQFDDSLCFLLDLETTGLSPTRDRVTQLAVCACVAAGAEGAASHPPVFVRYVSPGDRPIPRRVQEMTGVLPSHVVGLDELPAVWATLWQWIADQLERQGKRRAWLVGQNTFRFDFPLLCHELRRGYPGDDAAAAEAWTMGGLLARFGDTLPLLREWPWTETVLRGPPTNLMRAAEAPAKPSYALGNVYAHLFDRVIEHAHDALGDVLATREILQHLPRTLRQSGARPFACADVMRTLWNRGRDGSSLYARAATPQWQPSRPRRRRPPRQPSPHASEEAVTQSVLTEFIQST